ncbi:GNAT family N-acetyltransferase [Mesobacterium sp. TK19101]|uniref:GNAT family N-acetyltransferase n=1 Tax=Mesobacterium hydrothermale TaxID=3111907 RepID=A0ABU6HBB8_9RHOB|nr:GNAT family N-acetyltransferase [Mesobacterium sp. TK19101]MEC3859768.1 GNAT family N-acetyltransferase [Mesobacterium sp. TK19101]
MIITVTDDLAACHALRRAVFIEEQGIAEPDEWDDLDGQAVHFLVLDDAQPVATARLIPAGDFGKVGRICVLPSHRGAGLGAALVRHAVDHCRATPGVTRVFLSAQAHAIPFYERLGFVPDGVDYDDAGIPHRDMWLSL